MTPKKPYDADMAALTAAVALEIAGGVRADDEKYLARRVPTVRHDNPHLEHDAADKISRPMASNRRERRDALTRFANPAVAEPVDRTKAALHARHPALRDGRTIYPTRVFGAGDRARVLIAGINNAKIGGKVTKGVWAGMPIVTLSLEERATCPRSCAVWRECYGNAMPLAVRFRHDDALMSAIDRDLRSLGAKHPAGFVVRLHVLGDFVDAAYVARWATWLREIPQLHVWGYTAHSRASEVGEPISRLNATQWTRWSVRFSVARDTPAGPMQAAVSWDRINPRAVIEGDELMCPQELGLTRTCGTCGLCWTPDASHLRIVFMGHG